MRNIPLRGIDIYALQASKEMAVKADELDELERLEERLSDYGTGDGVVHISVQFSDLRSVCRQLRAVKDLIGQCVTGPWAEASYQQGYGDAVKSVADAMERATE
jgi:hypothetical protein